MKKLESFDFLDDKQWSPQWEEYLHDTLLFVPSKVQEILCITRIPDTNEILIVADNGRFINNKSILMTLHAFASAHCYPDYAIISRSLKKLKLFGQYKIPWYYQNFALFPLEKCRTNHLAQSIKNSRYLQTRRTVLCRND
ncbi:hypothetical protein [Enterococcus raffinosus]|uniref:hypothetical protein n=1 Tax=Enterococcus raffinosus TaxID=71452 RepID=UPI00209FD6AD|nr:hypothetical protein [Enterococcus raffinosus]